jgi:hypothetical protein
MLKAEDAGLRERLQGSIDAVRRVVTGLREAVNNLRLEEVDRPFPQLVSSLGEPSRSMGKPDSALKRLRGSERSKDIRGCWARAGIWASTQ